MFVVLHFFEMVQYLKLFLSNLNTEEDEIRLWSILFVDRNYCRNTPAEFLEVMFTLELFSNALESNLHLVSHNHCLSLAHKANTGSFSRRSKLMWIIIYKRPYEENAEIITIFLLQYISMDHRLRWTMKSSIGFPKDTPWSLLVSSFEHQQLQINDTGKCFWSHRI